jgi:hypothetical protein
MATFIWETCNTTHQIEADDVDEAYRIAISSRLVSQGTTPEKATEEDVLEATRWFNKNDRIIEIDSIIDHVGPYTGELPSED